MRIKCCMLRSLTEVSQQRVPRRGAVNVVGGDIAVHQAPAVEVSQRGQHASCQPPHLRVTLRQLQSCVTGSDKAITCCNVLFSCPATHLATCLLCLPNTRLLRGYPGLLRHSLIHCFPCHLEQESPLVQNCEHVSCAPLVPCRFTQGPITVWQVLNPRPHQAGGAQSRPRQSHVHAYHHQGCSLSAILQHILLHASLSHLIAHLLPCTRPPRSIMSPSASQCAPVQYGPILSDPIPPYPIPPGSPYPTARVTPPHPAPPHPIAHPTRPIPSQTASYQHCPQGAPPPR